ncbi:hypothetical protein AURDEDRAFT_61189 [Auricularia subglabra TFB-10046 SS5]|nr:hypothetical protein AURDEDRAFT_61189 [Auricularia subglabra TFB-10046 SS5]
MPATLPLLPNSLYILTQPLLHGDFHWSVVHIDAHGRGTRHHWAPAGAASGSTERYVEHEFRSAHDAGQAIAFFRLAGYVPLDVAALRAACAGLFPPGAAARTTAQNRAGGLSCRAWVSRLLARLRDAGHLPPQRAPESIEERVRARSAACELEYLNAFMFQRAYQPAVENV